MKLTNKILYVIFISIFSISLANAATVTLKDGRSFEGDIKSQDSKTLVLDMSGIEMRLPVKDVASIDLTESTTKSEKVEQQTTADSDNSSATVPAGTALTVRMAESVDTRNNKTGQRFTAVLEANLMSGDIIVAKKGSKVYGVLTNVKKAGRIAGTASMTLELRDISINDVMVAIRTQPVSGQGDNTAKTSVGRTARAAAIGGLIDGSDGAKTGAKVGVGAALLTKGDDIQIPKDSLLDFILSAPLER